MVVPNKPNSCVPFFLLLLPPISTTNAAPIVASTRPRQLPGPKHSLKLYLHTS
ncbi:hypothetical protein B0H19DRAFT_1152230 [Mycena capillaripes]|nr:hypothetical protein B0H19DRAFT_1152230 [Mycena capillaripes]